MGHHAQDIPSVAEDAGDIGERSVGVGIRADVSFRCRVAEDDPAIPLQCHEGPVITEIVAFHVADGDFEDLAGLQVLGEGCLVGFDAQVDLLADVFEAGIAHECAGEQTGFAKDLKAVADAENQAAGGSELLDRLHNGSEVSDGAGAEVVAVGEAAGNNDGIAVFEVFGLMPQEGGRLTGNFGDSVVSVVIAIGSGKDEDAEFHGSRLAACEEFCMAAGARGRLAVSS